MVPRDRDTEHRHLLIGFVKLATYYQVRAAASIRVLGYSRIRQENRVQILDTAEIVG